MQRKRHDLYHLDEIDNPSILLKKLLKRYKALSLTASALKLPISLESKKLINLLLTALSQKLSSDKQIYAIIFLLNQNIHVLNNDKELTTLFHRYFSLYSKYCIYFSDALSALLDVNNPFEEHLSNWISTTCKVLRNSYRLGIVTSNPCDEAIGPNMIYLYRRFEFNWLWPKYKFEIAFRPMAMKIVRIEMTNVLSKYHNELNNAFNNPLNYNLDKDIINSIFDHINNDTDHIIYHKNVELSETVITLSRLKWVPKKNCQELTTTLIDLLAQCNDYFKHQACKIIIGLKIYLEPELITTILRLLDNLLPNIKRLEHSFYLDICSTMIALSCDMSIKQKNNVINSLIMIIKQYHEDSHIQVKACELLTSTINTSADSTVIELIDALNNTNNNEIRNEICLTLGKLNSFMSEDIKQEAINALKICQKKFALRSSACLALFELDPTYELLNTINHDLETIATCRDSRKLHTIEMVKISLNKLNFCLNTEEKNHLISKWIEILSSMDIYTNDVNKENSYFIELKKHLSSMLPRPCIDFFILALTDKRNRTYRHIHSCLYELREYISSEEWNEIGKLLLNNIQLDDTINEKNSINSIHLISAFRLRKYINTDTMDNLEDRLLPLLLESNSKWIGLLTNDIPSDKWIDIFCDLVSELSIDMKHNEEILKKCNLLCGCFPKIIDPDKINNQVIKKIIDFLHSHPVNLKIAYTELLFKLKAYTSHENQLVIIDTLIPFQKKLKLLDLYGLGASDVNENIKILVEPHTKLGSFAERGLDDIDTTSYSQKILILNKLKRYPSNHSMIRFSEIYADYMEEEKREVLKHVMQGNEEVVERINMFKI